MNIYREEEIEKLIEGLFIIVLLFSLVIVYQIASSLNVLEKYDNSLCVNELNRKTRILVIISVISLMYYLFILFKKYKRNPDQNSILIFLLVIFIIGFSLVKLYLSIKEKI